MESTLTANRCLTFLLIGLIFADWTGSANSSSCFDPVSDPCNTEIPVIPNMASRDPTVIITNTTSHWTFCDVYIINTTVWYRSKDPMSTSCPSMYMCGTKFPIWMNGENPDTHEGLVNRTSCVRDFDSCCLHSYTLAALNCGEFIAYCFVDLPSGCHQRYCFDVTNWELVTDISYTPTSSKTSTELINVTATETTITSYTNGVSQTSLATTDLDISSSGANQSAHHTTAKTIVEEPETAEDDSLIVIMLVCMGVMVAIIFVLVTIIIRRQRKAKVVDQNMNEKPHPEDDTRYETLRTPEFMKVNVVDSIYEKPETVDAVGAQTNELDYDYILSPGQNYHPSTENGKVGIGTECTVVTAEQDMYEGKGEYATLSESNYMK